MQVLSDLYSSTAEKESKSSYADNEQAFSNQDMSFGQMREDAKVKTDCHLHKAWNEWKESPSSIEKSSFFIIGNKDIDSLRQLFYEITYHSSSVEVSGDFEAVLAAASQNPSQWRAIFIHIADKECMVPLVDRLVSFRRSTPSVPIILVSPTFGTDNFGLERAAIADVSIREPVRCSWLEAYINMALVNNQIWQNRQQQM